MLRAGSVLARGDPPPVLARPAPWEGHTIQIDEMSIQWNQWAVDVVWYTNLGDYRYKKTSNVVCTIPVSTCIDCPGLEWESTTGNISVLAEVDFQKIDKEWVSATKT